MFRNQLRVGANVQITNVCDPTRVVEKAEVRDINITHGQFTIAVMTTRGNLTEFIYDAAGNAWRYLFRNSATREFWFNPSSAKYLIG